MQYFSPFACDIVNSGAWQKDYAISNIHQSGWDLAPVCVCAFLFHLWISVMLSAPDGIAAGFSLLCLLFALTALPGRTGALTSVKEFLLKLRVRGGLTHTQTHTHTCTHSSTAVFVSVLRKVHTEIWIPVGMCSWFSTVVQLRCRHKDNTHRITHLQLFKKQLSQEWKTKDIIYQLNKGS